MSKFALHAAIALSVASPAAWSADWTLTFNGTLFNADISPGQPQTTQLVLNIQAEDQLSTSTASYGLGQGYRVTSFSGTRNGQAITSILSSSDPFFHFGIDNYIYPGDPQIVGGNGLAYKTADGTLYTLYGYTATFVNPPQVQQWEMNSQHTSVDFPPYVTYTGTITLAPVPEPASVALLLSGLALVGAAVRRRQQA